MLLGPCKSDRVPGSRLQARKTRFDAAPVRFTIPAGLPAPRPQASQGLWAPGAGELLSQAARYTSQEYRYSMPRIQTYKNQPTHHSQSCPPVPRISRSCSFGSSFESFPSFPPTLCLPACTDETLFILTHSESVGLWASAKRSHSSLFNTTGPAPRPITIHYATAANESTTDSASDGRPPTVSASDGRPPTSAGDAGAGDAGGAGPGVDADRWQRALGARCRKRRGCWLGRDKAQGGHETVTVTVAVAGAVAVAVARAPAPPQIACESQRDCVLCRLHPNSGLCQSLVIFGTHYTARRLLAVHCPVVSVPRSWIPGRRRLRQRSARRRPRRRRAGLQATFANTAAPAPAV